MAEWSKAQDLGSCHVKWRGFEPRPGHFWPARLHIIKSLIATSTATIPAAAATTLAARSIAAAAHSAAVADSLADSEPAAVELASFADAFPPCLQASRRPAAERLAAPALDLRTNV